MLNKTKLILVSIGALLIIGGASFGKIAYNNYIGMKAERDSYRNNQRSYENIIAGKTDENRVLSLSTADLRDSNDSLVQVIEKNRKSLKTAKNKPGDISTGIETSIRDTDAIHISNPTDFRLDTIVKFNDLTKTSIKIYKDSLISSIDVNNLQTLFVYSQREFVNKREGWFDRLIHLDYKKENYDKYTIENTNELIKVGNVRVIKVR